MTFPTDPAQLTRDEHVRASLAAFRRRSRWASRARFVRALIEARERPVLAERVSLGLYQLPTHGGYPRQARDVGASARAFFDAGPGGKS